METYKQTLVWEADSGDRCDRLETSRWSEVCDVSEKPSARQQGLDSRFETLKQALRPRFDGLDAGSAGRLDADLRQG